MTKLFVWNNIGNFQEKYIETLHKYYEGGMSYLTLTNVAEYIFPCWVNKMFPVLRMFFGMRGWCDWSKEIN